MITWAGQRPSSPSSELRGEVDSRLILMKLLQDAGEICPTTNTLLPMRPKEGALVPWAKLGLPSDL